MIIKRFYLERIYFVVQRTFMIHLAVFHLKEAHCSGITKWKYYPYFLLFSDSRKETILWGKRKTLQPAKDRSNEGINKKIK